jgi:2-amino-4-hydroxy-6-hydroxymethyldihydropteridine diphosphokinase
VSKVYETPSWGFDSDAFYNCALIVHTFSSAQDSYRGLKDRKELGRIRGEGRLSSRIIDIDLIAFDEEIINSEKLQIPHPLMQDRKFVLLPYPRLKLEQHPF